MIIHSIHHSEQESYFSNCSSERRLKIDTKKSENSELEFKNIQRLEISEHIDDSEKQLAIKKELFSSESLENNISFEFVSSNEIFLQEIENNLEVNPFELPFDALRNCYFLNESHSDLKISAVYTLTTPQTNNLTQNLKDFPSFAKSENLIQECNNLCSFEKNRNKFNLKDKFDNIQRPSPITYITPSTMEFKNSPQNNSFQKCRPKLKSIYLSRRKLRVLECTLSETECHTNNISTRLESENQNTLDLQTNSVNHFEKCLEKEMFKTTDEIHLQSYSTSEKSNQFKNSVEIQPSKNHALTMESDVELQCDNMLTETLLLTDDALLKAAVPDTPIKSQKEDSDFINENVFSQSRTEEPKFLSEFESSESNSEDLLSTPENILDFFMTQSCDELTEMLNATKFEPLKMTLRDRSGKKNLQKEIKSLITTPRKTVPKRKVLPQNKDNSLEGIKMKKIKCVRLKKSQNINQEKQYSSGKYTPESLACDNCGERFPSWPQRIKHWQITKHKVPTVCGWCDKSYYFIHKHIINTHPSLCENCGQIFTHPHDKIRHSEQHIYKNIYCCNVCMYSAESEELFRLHMEDHLGKRLYVCEFCEKDFVNECFLENHLKKFHFECTICNFKCISLPHFEEHKLKHKEKAPFSCALCDKVCSNSKTLKYHVLGQHKKIKPYVCDICNKAFVVKNKLSDHLKGHENKNYVCDVCGQQFLEETYLISHQEDHNVFICNFCSSEYKKKCNLINHLIGSTREGFMCQKCEYDFNCRTGYDKHMEMHEKKGDMTTMCQFCNVEFKNNTLVKHHMIVSHPKEYAKVNNKTETCMYCKHICSSRHHLFKHIRLKHPEKRKSVPKKKVRDRNSPYECSNCNMSFTYICGFNKHVKSKLHLLRFKKM